GPRAHTQTEWRGGIDLGDRERLRHIQKKGVGGEVAGGIAHDLNKIPTVIVGSSPLLLHHPEVGQSAGQRGLINLCVNARDAMPEGGRIFIESQNADVRAAEPAAIGMAMKPGRYVRFSVSDTGSGMDRTTLAQVFEPFFTTKQPDKGMGL